MSSRQTASGRSVSAITLAVLAGAVVCVGCIGCASSDQTGWAQTGPRLTPAVIDGDQVTLGARSDATTDE